MSATWSFAVPDWRDRLIEGRSLVPTLPLDRVEADRAVAVFNRLRLPDVPGQPREPASGSPAPAAGPGPGGKTDGKTEGKTP